VDGKGAIRIHCTKYRLRVEAIINQPRTDLLRDDVAGRHSFDGVESIYRWVNYLVRINKEERQMYKPSVRKHNTQGGCVRKKQKQSSRWQPPGWQGTGATLVATNAATLDSISRQNSVFYY